MTNHVVVAMIEDEVKQTRCTTCDADHEYKQAKGPSPRRPKTVAAIQEGAESFAAKPVLAPPPRVTPSQPAETEPDAAPSSAPVAGSEDIVAPLAAAPAPSLDGLVEEPAAADEDEGPVHRRLIRATLPRPEGHVPERKEPEFTVRQPGARGGREVDGNRIGYWPKGQQAGGHARFGGSRQGSGQHSQRHGGGRGPNNGQRSGRPDGNRGQRGPGSGRRRGGR